MPNGQCRQGGIPFPRGTEGGGQTIGPGKAKCFVRALERAVAVAAQQDVLPVPENGEVDLAITIEVDRVGTVDIRQVGDR